MTDNEQWNAELKSHKQNLLKEREQMNSRNHGIMLPSDVMVRRGGVVVSIKDSTPTVTPESIKAGEAVIEILKRPGYDQYRTANEQRNAQRGLK